MTLETFTTFFLGEMVLHGFDNDATAWHASPASSTPSGFGALRHPTELPFSLRPAAGGGGGSRTGEHAMRFEGRVAAVTGGGRGIGEATCELLAAQGAAVVVSDLDQDAAEAVAGRIQPAGGKAEAIATDVTQASDAQSMVETARERFGRLDILVCSAGITRDNLLFKMTDDDWGGVISPHLPGSFNCVRAAQAPMVEQRYGKMILLSSTSALGNRGQTNYSTAKAGLQGMTKTLAIELGPFGINVNAVAPGFVETRMTQATAERLGMDWETYKAERAKAVPLRRTGKPIDIANVIAFLASEESSYVSGQVIYVAGGARG